LGVGPERLGNGADIEEQRMGTFLQETQHDGSSHEPGATTWRSVQSGIWVANRGGEFAGMIERRRAGGYLATTRLGKALGAFSTMQEAQRAMR
jgi:hypothetical protein